MSRRDAHDCSCLHGDPNECKSTTRHDCCCPTAKSYNRDKCKAASHACLCPQLKSYERSQCKASSHECTCSLGDPDRRTDRRTGTSASAARPRATTATTARPRHPPSPRTTGRGDAAIIVDRLRAGSSIRSHRRFAQAARVHMPPRQELRAKQLQVEQAHVHPDAPNSRATSGASARRSSTSSESCVPLRLRLNYNNST